MYGAYFQANSHNKQSVISCYMVIQSSYHNVIDLNRFFNGDWDAYMQEEFRNPKRRLNHIYDEQSEALKSLESPTRINAGTAYLLRFIFPKQDVIQKIMKGNFSTTIYDVVDCRDLLDKVDTPKITNNNNFNPNEINEEDVPDRTVPVLEF